MGLRPAGEQRCITGCIATGGGETQCFFLSLGPQGFPDNPDNHPPVHTHTSLAFVGTIAVVSPLPSFCSLFPFMGHDAMWRSAKRTVVQWRLVLDVLVVAEVATHHPPPTEFASREARVDGDFDILHEDVIRDCSFIDPYLITRVSR